MALWGRETSIGWVGICSRPDPIRSDGWLAGRMPRKKPSSSGLSVSRANRGTQPANHTGSEVVAKLLAMRGDDACFEPGAPNRDHHGWSRGGPVAFVVSSTARCGRGRQASPATNVERTSLRLIVGRQPQWIGDGWKTGLDKWTGRISTGRASQRLQAGMASELLTTGSGREERVWSRADGRTGERRERGARERDK